MSSEPLLQTIASYMQCAWVVLVDCRVIDGSPVYTLVNEVGDKHPLKLDEVKEELRGFFFSILGIEDESLLAFENSVLSRRKGLIHLLNGLGTEKSGLQGLVRTTLKSVINLIGFRLAHPDFEPNDQSPNFVVVVAGRYWGTLDASEVCPRVGCLSALFDFITEHRSMARLLDFSKSLNSKLSTIESWNSTKQTQEAILFELQMKISTAGSASSSRAVIANALEEAGDRLCTPLNLHFYEEFRQRSWTLNPHGEWQGSAFSLPLSDILDKSPGSIIRVSSLLYCVILVSKSAGFTNILLLSVTTNEGEPYSDNDLRAILNTVAAMLQYVTNHDNFFLMRNSQVDFDSSALKYSTYSDSVREELHSDERKLSGSFLFHSLFTSCSPYLNILPVYVGEEEVLELYEMTTLPSQLSSSIRNLCFTLQRSNSEASSAFHMLSSLSAYVHYFSNIFTSEKVVPADRALLIYDNNFIGIRSQEDLVVFVVLCNSEVLIPPTFFERLKQSLHKCFLPFQIMNQITVAVVPRKDFDQLRMSYQGLSNWAESLQSVIKGTPHDDGLSLQANDTIGLVHFNFCALESAIGNTILIYTNRVIFMHFYM